MKLKNFSAICFDMDFTLVSYSLEKFLPMMYGMAAKFLVEKKGYQKELQHFDDQDLKLMRQGLILDKATHHFLDLASTGDIISVHDGKSFLSHEKTLAIYPDGKWPHFDTFYKAFECDVSTPYNHADMSYFFHDSCFVSPVIPLMAKHMRTLSRCDSDFSNKCKTLYSDVMESFNFNFHPDVFKTKSGFFFPEMIKNTDLYIEKASPKLKERLKELKDNGTKLMVITASHIDYAELLMTYAYGDNWRDYFDIVICRARKPGFFWATPQSRPFYLWNEKNETTGIEKITEINTENVFLEGHWTFVDKWIKCNAEKPGRVAYVGDSFKSDIIPTKLFTSWDLFAIVLEGKKFLRDENCDHVSKKAHIDESGGWGSFFGSQEQSTICAGKLMAHADITFSDIEALASLGLDEDFESGCFYDFNPY